MSQPLRYEDPNATYLITTRTISSRLWFANNKKLVKGILAYLAKYTNKYNVRLVAFILMGNHYHLLARFPDSNKAEFMRAFNSIVAKLVARHVPSFKDGKLWARRYSEQVLPRNEDVEHWFFYCALNPVLSGLVARVTEYDSYNSFSDAVSDRRRQFKVLRLHEYNEALQRGLEVEKSDFIDTFELKFERLPGYEEYDQARYIREMLSQMEERRREAIQIRFEAGKRFPDPERLRNIVPGASPHKTKTSHRYSFRPLVLTLCKEARRAFLDGYFELVRLYKEASSRYLEGAENVVFPRFTYKPPILCCR